jgi:hypothetical protein
VAIPHSFTSADFNVAATWAGKSIRLDVPGDPVVRPLGFHPRLPVCALVLDGFLTFYDAANQSLRRTDLNGHRIVSHVWHPDRPLMTVAANYGCPVVENSRVVTFVPATS